MGFFNGKSSPCANLILGTKTQLKNGAVKGLGPKLGATAIMLLFPKTNSMSFLQRILLVEDDCDIQAVTQLTLEAVGGFTVRVTSSGPEALECVNEFAPDLIILDVMMPGMDGPTVLQKLRADEKTAHFPVVFMTAKAQSHEIAAYKKMGALEVITKPFDPMRLPLTLRQIWSKASKEEKMAHEYE